MKLKDYIRKHCPSKTFSLVNTKGINDLKDEDTHLIWSENLEYYACSENPKEIHPKLLDSEPVSVYMVDDDTFCSIFFNSERKGYVKEKTKALIALFPPSILDKELIAEPYKPFC